MVAQSRGFFNGSSKLAKKNYHIYGKISLIKVFNLLLTSNGEATGIDLIMMANGDGDLSNGLNYILKAIELIKKKKAGQYEEKIIHIRKREFVLSEKEALDSLKGSIQ